MSLLLLLRNSGGGGPPQTEPVPTATVGWSPSREYLYEIIDRINGTNRVGFWRDAAPPRFVDSINGGLGGLTVDLPRVMGMADEPGEPGSLGTLQHGYKVIVSVADKHNLDQGVFPPEDAQRVIYVGTIEDIVFTPRGVRVEILPLQRTLEQATIPGLVTYTSMNVTSIAQQIVNSYSPLPWDTNNPIDFLGPVTTWQVKNSNVAAELRKLAQFAGKDYTWFVSRAGTVRWFKQGAGYFNPERPTEAVGTVVHRFSLYEVTDYELRRSSRGQIKKVRVVWGNEETPQEATSADFTFADPRGLIVSAPQITNATDALTYANNLLAALDRLTFQGRVFVSADRYPVETIRPGDQIVFNLPRQLGTNGDYTSANDFTYYAFICASVTYEAGGVWVEFEQTLADTRNQVRELGRRVMDYISHTIDAIPQRPVAGVLKVADQFRVASLGVGNSAAASTPGSVVKKIEVFDSNGTSLGFIPVYDAIT